MVLLILSVIEMKLKTYQNNWIHKIRLAEIKQILIKTFKFDSQLQ